MTATVEDMMPGDWFALEGDQIGRVYMCLARPVEVGRKRHRLTSCNAFGHSTDLRVHRVTVWSSKPCRRLSEAEVVAALRDLRSRMLDPVAVRVADLAPADADSVASEREVLSS